MDWQVVRERYPAQWLVVEAEGGYTAPQGHRHVESVKVLDTCLDGGHAYARYRALHRAHPEHEYYFVHTGECWRLRSTVGWA